MLSAKRLQHAVSETDCCITRKKYCNRQQLVHIVVLSAGLQHAVSETDCCIALRAVTGTDCCVIHKKTTRRSSWSSLLYYPQLKDYNTKLVEQSIVTITREKGFGDFGHL